MNTDQRIAIIAGSARSDGDTRRLTDLIVTHTGWDHIDLNDYSFTYFDYEHLNRHDDYLTLMRRLISNYDTFLFATPVYWYAMSGIMKVFFDRFTDLLTIEKPLGRQLRGKSMAGICCSTGADPGEAFWLPFSASARYLGMDYLGHLHTRSGLSDPEGLEDFLKSIRHAAGRS